MPMTFLFFFVCSNYFSIQTDITFQIRRKDKKKNKKIDIGSSFFTLNRISQNLAQALILIVQMFTIRNRFSNSF